MSVMHWFVILVALLVGIFGIRKGFFIMWGTIFNVLVSIYLGVMLTPLIIGTFQKEGVSCYCCAGCVVGITLLLFAMLESIVYCCIFKGSKVIYTHMESGRNEIKEIAVNDRGIDFGTKTQFRILLKDDCIESYCNNYLMTINRIPKWNGKIGIASTGATISIERIYQTQNE